MSEVEDGSAADRNQAVNTWYSRTNQANKMLKSSMFLYHYWTGAQEDVHILNEYANVEDATEAIRTAAKIRQTAFPNEEERRAAWCAQAKYFVNWKYGTYTVNYPQRNKVLIGMCKKGRG